MTREEIAKKYVPCRCDKAYTDRGMTAPDCPYHSTDPESAMDEYMRQCCLELLEYISKNDLHPTWYMGDDGNKVYMFSHKRDIITKEQLFENFL